MRKIRIGFFTFILLLGASLTLALVKPFFAKKELFVIEHLAFEQKVEASHSYGIFTFDPLSVETEYQITLKDSRGKIIKSLETKEHKIQFDELMFADQELLQIVVQTKMGKQLVESSLVYQWKRPVIIYLSPSNQTDNLGVQRAGFTNESEMLNFVADYVEPILLEAGFIVYRNHPDMGLEAIVNESKSLDVDLHLALHSNAMTDYGESDIRGVNTFVYEETSSIEPLAQQLQAALMAIYPGPTYNSSVLYSVDGYPMRETNPDKVDHGILMEIGFHDNYYDAKWLTDHIEAIGTAIGEAIVDYFLA